MSTIESNAPASRFADAGAALRRLMYLRARLAAYDYETHVGGYLYSFVRGVRPNWRDDDSGAPSGVHRGRPPLALVEALDRLMLGGVA
ncbi:hypothetical protein JYK05_04360 [Caballeronia sp. M1242]|nr:hypothetical protein [Caballeronia sp. M1242]QSN62128.1 hypothetical protein JYK05_04360 [Caballeronia sp. M1242]